MLKFFGFFALITHVKFFVKLSCSVYPKLRNNFKLMKQLRPPVIKAKGVTPSERYLARLAEKSFLNLWSYPSPYRDQRQGNRGDGKEICDLLVVCGNYIIIFSEKTVTWPSGKSGIAWSRWAKRAIRDSAKQAAGAARWITVHPDRIFLDRECKEPFPIDLPPESERIIHRIVVANGAAEVCKLNIPESSGSLIIRPDVKGNAHWSRDHNRVRPFYIGDIDPSDSFVHVFNETALDIVMNELDTVTDFAYYLDKKANLIRSGRLIQAAGEENLLAYYAIRVNESGEHDFVPESFPLKIDNTRYSNFVNDPRYTAKKAADQISYFWDRLIEFFTNHMLDGTEVTLGNNKFHQLRENELCVRFMALESRFLRRSHGEAVKSALEIGIQKDRYFRLIIRERGTKNSDTAFFILIIRYRGNSSDTREYEQYRINRCNLAQNYAICSLEKSSHLKRVIGIALEPPGQPHDESADMVYAEVSWTEEERKAIREECRKLNILQSNLKSHRWSGQEYPEV